MNRISNWICLNVTPVLLSVHY